MNLNQAIQASRAGKQAAMQNIGGKRKGARITFTMSTELLQDFRRACEQQDVKPNEVLRVMMKNYVDRVEALQNGKL